MDTLPFCKCGCGQQVSKPTNQYISGHNKTFQSEESKRKNRERQTGKNNSFYGKKHTEESRYKMSLSRKGVVSHRKGKKLPQHVIQKMKETHLKNGKLSWKKIYYEKNIAIYESYSKKLTIDEAPKYDKLDKNALTVLCSNCRKRFIPKLTSVQERVRCLNSNDGCESKIYCSEKCKKTCGVYKKKIYQAGHPKSVIYTDDEHQQFREYVLERDNYKCQYCGETAEHVHHERPQKLEPFFALDPDLAWSVCKKCHYEKGHEGECSTGTLSKIICR